MFVTNWISTTKIQKISEITNFFRHYFLSRTEVDIWSCDQVLLNFGLGGFFFFLPFLHVWPPRFILFRQVILIR